MFPKGRGDVTDEGSIVEALEVREKYIPFQPRPLLNPLHNFPARQSFCLL